MQEIESESRGQAWEASMAVVRTWLLFRRHWEPPMA